MGADEEFGPKRTSASGSPHVGGTPENVTVVLPRALADPETARDRVRGGVRQETHLPTAG